MDAYDLDQRLSQLLDHDGISADAATLRAANNAAYRSLCQTTQRNRLKAQLVAAPAALTPAMLGEVSVAMPLLTDDTPQFWEVERVWYPDTSKSTELDKRAFELREGNLILFDVQTDGTATLTVEGLAFGEPLVNDADEPVLIPVDCQMAIVWSAYVEWASVYATTPEQFSRITFYQQLAEQKRKLLFPRVRRKPLERSGHMPRVQRISVP